VQRFPRGTIHHRGGVGSPFLITRLKASTFTGFKEAGGEK
jgi:hypothetical protein